MGAFLTMAGHPLHLTVVSGLQPFGEIVSVLGEINTGKTQCLKAQLLAPLTDRVQRRSVGRIRGATRVGNRVCPVGIVTDARPSAVHLMNDRGLAPSPRI